MIRRIVLASALLVLGLAGYGAWRFVEIRREGNSKASAQPVAPDPSKDPVYVCPMDPDIRSNTPGNCDRCGMALVAGIPDQVEFPVDFSVSPPSPQPQRPAVLKFAVHDPWKDQPVTKFIPVHERLFHAFIVSQDLSFFEHAHPILNSNEFDYSITFPKAGMFRILTDFYPEGATPQLITKTVFLSGEGQSSVTLSRDYTTKSDKNLTVSLETMSESPLAGAKTRLRFTLSPADGVEKYLGAWAHMLAASDDLIDMLHQHPFVADGGPHLEFDVAFPRARSYRLWVQFQRRGIVNTVHFDVPVSSPSGSAGKQ